MLDTLNSFELAILEEISMEYSFLQSHLPFLKVKDRKYTGVGQYVDFTYLDVDGNCQPIPIHFSVLSSNSMLQMDGLKCGFSYEIAVTNQCINFLEVVTNGEDWDGSIKNYWFER